MKKPLIFVITLIFILSLGTKSFADGTEVSFAEKAGITPDSIFYPLDVALDNAKIFLTIGEKNKINVIVDVAEERLGESEVMLEKGEQDKVQELVQEYEAKIQEAYEKLEKITEESIIDDTETENDLDDQIDEIEIDETDIDEESSEDEADTEETIEERFRLRQENSIGVLIRIKDSLPEQARERTQKVIEMQTAKKEAVANMVQARHQCNSAKQELKRAQIRLKKAMKSGDEEQVREVQETVTQKKIVEEQAKKELSMAIAKKKEAVKIKVGNGKDKEEKAIDEEEYEDEEIDQYLDKNKDEDEDDDIHEEHPTEKADDEKVKSKAYAKEAIKKVNKVKGNKKVKSNNGKALGRKKQ